MSTMDVPGANPINGDALHVGCWAEHDDGSLIFIAGTENHVVTFQIFDVSKTPVIEYRDRMAVGDFNRRFTTRRTFGGQSTLNWTWRDKTPFPWERVIDAGARSGAQLTSADAILNQADDIRRSRNRFGITDDTAAITDNRSAAAQVAADLQIQGQELIAEEIESIVRRYIRRPMRKLSNELTQMLARRFSTTKPASPPDDNQ